MQKRQTILVIFIGLTVGWSALSVPAFSQDNQNKKFVFVPGPKDHGAPGRHQYEKDLRVLAYALEHASNLTGVTTQFYVGKVPEDINELNDADVIILHGSSDRSPRETHPLFPSNASTDGKTYSGEDAAYLQGFDQLMKKGVGLVVFHYTNQVANESAQKYYLEWLGGFWRWIPGAPVAENSTNPVDDWSMTFATPDHPILRGVTPWSYMEEIFCRFYMPEDPGRTPLLTGTPAKRTDVGPQVAAWAYERRPRGRGFVMGGLDWNSNLLIDDHRRFLLNGIVWAAGMEVPAGGVALAPIPEDMVVVSPANSPRR